MPARTILARIVAALLLLAAAFAIESSSTLGWGGAWGAGDTRFKVSPAGIVHVLKPRQAVSPTATAQWAPEGGDASLRAIAPGGENAYRRLQSVGVFLETAFWLALLAGGLLLALSRSARFPRALFLLPAVPAVLTIAAVALFVGSAQRALAVLVSLDFGFGGSLGAMLVSAAPLLCALAIVILTAPRLLLPAAAIAGAVWYVNVMLVETWVTALAPPLLFVTAIAVFAARRTPAPVTSE